MDELKFSMEIESNIDEIQNASKEAIEKAMEAIGLKAVGYAALLCPVDTGRLRNSIVYVTNKSGGSKGGNNQEGERATDEDMKENGTPDESTVVIGTNVEYAEDIELGRSKKAPNGFLKPAIENHVSEYKQILEKTLSSA